MSREIDELVDRAGDPLLRTVLNELRAGRGITSSTAAALPGAAVGDGLFDEFLGLLVREALAARETLLASRPDISAVALEAAGDPFLDLAIVLVRWVERRGAGHDALDYCLGRLPRSTLESIAGRLITATDPDFLVWSHRRMVTVVGHTGLYKSFLERHGDLVLGQCFDEMSAYLLDPGLGVAGYEVLEWALARVDDPVPVQRRFISLIDGGGFDDNRLALYAMLGDHRDEPRFRPLADATYSYVRARLTSPAPASVAIGLSYLIGMIEHLYRGAGAFGAIQVPYATADQRMLLEPIRAGLRAVVAPSSSEESRRSRARDHLHRIHTLDDRGISGYWQSRV